MTITIIDTFGFFFRSFYALPPLKNSKGFPTGLLTGFLNFINKLEREHETDYIVFALDSKEKSFRNDIYSEYKANRPDAPEDLKKQLPIAIEWIEKMGFKTLSLGGFEADDVIATVTKIASKNGLKVRIISHDKDMYQLIKDEKIVIYDPSKEIEIDEKGCFEKFGVYPKDFIEFQSLLGDSSDNVPGVKGIGLKGAAELVNKYGTVDSMIKNIENITPQRAKTALLNGTSDAILSKKLITLKDDIFNELNFNEFKLPEKNPILRISSELLEYDMNGILNRAKSIDLANKSQAAPQKVPNKIEFETIILDRSDKLFETIKKIPKDALVAFDVETTSLNVREAKLVGFSFAYDKNMAFYVPVGHFYLGVGEQISLDDCKKAIQMLFERKIIGQNLKYDIAITKNYLSIDFDDFYADTMILAWLIDPENAVGLDKLAKRYLNHEMIHYKDTVAKNEDFSSVEIQRAAFYAAEDAYITLTLFEKLLDKAKSTDEIKKEYFEVEIPFIRTLLNMESHGIKIDTSFFQNLKSKSELAIKELEKKIHQVAGHEFNINSTKQLGTILYDYLKLPVFKKTKTALSTDDNTLTKLYDKHEIVPLIQEYRELFKLHSTYILPLLKLALEEKDKRIHTSFLQTGTSTGRLASKNPNLQNIPTKTELGKQIREGFIAEDGFLLVGLDYSQIELRLLAHFSEDPTLIKAFNEDKDIHLETASKIFGEENAKEKRSLAKSVNFGLLYGMGSKKLSETVGISVSEAKTVIENYFKTFSSVKNYFGKIKSDIKNTGFVPTLLGRRRYFDYSNANAMQLAMFEREAVNSKFQGSAADLVKLAMNKIDNKYKNNPNVKMLLQIHDELVFEIKEEIVEEIANDLQNIMENIYKLKIPLKCSRSIAKNWKELK